MMHPVIQHILARRDCTTPPKDGRKIVLALPGGSLSGINGTGALTALADMGLTNAFDAIYTFSAGLPNAAYFLANQARLSTTVYADNLCDRQFINWWTPWRVANVDHLIHVLQFEKRLTVDKVLNSSTELFVWMRNVRSREVNFIKAQPKHPDDIFQLFRAAVMMPYFAPGAVEYEGEKYKDVGLKAPQFVSAVLNHSDITDLLVIYNRDDQKFPLPFVTNTEIFEIIPQEELHGFESNREKLYQSARQMEDQVKKIFTE